MVKLKTTRFDAADYLKSDNERALFLESAIEGGDTAHIARAREIVARARGMMGGNAVNRKMPGTRNR